MLARRFGLGGEVGRRSTIAWLAVFAVLAQAILFDLAMAARETAAAQARAVAAHHAHRETPGHGRKAPGHKHQEDCPFCVARATHQAPASPDGVAGPGAGPGHGGEADASTCPRPGAPPPDPFPFPLPAGRAVPLNLA